MTMTASLPALNVPISSPRPRLLAILAMPESSIRTLLSGITRMLAPQSVLDQLFLVHAQAHADALLGSGSLLEEALAESFVIAHRDLFSKLHDAYTGAVDEFIRHRRGNGGSRRRGDVEHLKIDQAESLSREGLLRAHRPARRQQAEQDDEPEAFPGPVVSSRLTATRSLRAATHLDATRDVPPPSTRRTIQLRNLTTS